ncbi:cytochrome c oxidase subunit II [Devosia enhydra]|uniref:cytochrome c oxidase subunit II n=1 Tax=Devosia enhydra TaxID=665118 RepID=UPI001FCD7E51|nr:cytochrome c oxidase subunit II [Devosia enhydra]
MATAAMVSGCTGPLSTLDVAGPAAGSVATLWWVMLAGSVVLFLLVALLLWASYRRPGLIARMEPGRFVFWLGLVMPALVLTALVTTALALGERLLPQPGTPQPMRIEARAEQWRWVFSYPDLPGAAPTPDVLHMPAGQPVDIVVTSADVVHAFWIPRLGGKIDAIPGHTNIIRLLADRPGSYHGVCAEFCGTGHTIMRFMAEAHPAETLATVLGVDP